MSRLTCSIFLDFAICNIQPWGLCGPKLNYRIPCSLSSSDRPSSLPHLFKGQDMSEKVQIREHKLNFISYVVLKTIHSRDRKKKDCTKIRGKIFLWREKEKSGKYEVHCTSKRKNIFWVLELNITQRYTSCPKHEIDTQKWVKYVMTFLCLLWTTKTCTSKTCICQHEHIWICALGALVPTVWFDLDWEQSDEGMQRKSARIVSSNRKSAARQRNREYNEDQTKQKRSLLEIEKSHVHGYSQ
jgi:hypothetical protein